MNNNISKMNKMTDAYAAKAAIRSLSHNIKDIKNLMPRVLSLAHSQYKSIFINCNR